MNRMTQRTCVLILFLWLWCPLTAQEVGRYASEMLPAPECQSDIKYGNSLLSDGNRIDLLMDVWTVKGDTAQSRPLLIFIHGGGFQNGDKKGKFSNNVCASFAKAGYVTSSINYRLSSPLELSDSVKYFEAFYRAVQDGKKAVMYFRKNAQMYRIDTSKIFVMGSSAGAKTALGMAYCDQDEVPSFVDTQKLGQLEPTDNAQYFSSAFKGIINCWGAIWDYQWINDGDIPVYSVHGELDDVVPLDSSYSFHGFKYGSQIIYARARETGTTTGIRLFPNTGHTLDNNTAKQDSAIQDIRNWLSEILQKDQLINSGRGNNNSSFETPK